MHEEKLAEMAEDIYRSCISRDEILVILQQAYALGMAQGRADENEAIATLIQDWHVPRQGGTHEMAFQIRSRTSGEEEKL